MDCAEDQYANLAVVDYARIANNDPDAERLLLQAGLESGFFYLDLREHGRGKAPINDPLNLVNALYNLAQEVFDHDIEEKMKYDLDVIGPHKIHGYKPLGRNTGVSAQKQDGFEIYLVPTDHFHTGNDEATARCLDSIARTRSLQEAFVKQAHEIGCTLLRSLSRSLGANSSVSSLEQFHRLGRRSTSALGLLKYPPQSELARDRLGQIAHTDVGSITLLFARKPGLQVMSLAQPTAEAKMSTIPNPITAEIDGYPAQRQQPLSEPVDTPRPSDWYWILPRTGHAVVNIGDSLRFLTGSRLKSSLHRVVPSPCSRDDDRSEPRYSLAYFMRPEYDATFSDDEGASWTGLGWHTRKFEVFRAPREVQEKGSVLTGRKDYLGLWEAA